MPRSGKSNGRMSGCRWKTRGITEMAVGTVKRGMFWGMGEERMVRWFKLGIGIGCCERGVRFWIAGIA